MSKYNILVIDDENKVVKKIKNYFQNENYNVISASTGEEGIKKIKNKKPDLVILDIILPGIDGWEVCKKIRKISQLPIIILSSKSSDTSKIKGIKLGADDYVVKPFNPEEVLVRAKSILNRVKDNENKYK